MRHMITSALVALAMSGASFGQVGNQGNQGKTQNPQDPTAFQKGNADPFGPDQNGPRQKTETKE